MSSKEHVQRVWTIGSYPDISREFLSMAAHLVNAVTVDPSYELLDIACGTGNVAITAARRGAHVTGVDITPAMLAEARENATIAGVKEIDWQEGDATDLPFADDAFDTTVSCVVDILPSLRGENSHLFIRQRGIASGMRTTVWGVK